MKESIMEFDCGCVFGNKLEKVCEKHIPKLFKFLDGIAEEQEIINIREVEE